MTRVLLAFPVLDDEYSLWVRVGGGGGHSVQIAECDLYVLEHLALG